MKYIGQSVPALNNRQLAAGKGTFVADLQPDGIAAPPGLTKEFGAS